ncbi:hypothetical protein [Flaviaesturariibacter amylovorans]|uniref:BatD family protein n=1 Tax=Flaviaesturariibacter amylovorans TaxID=1084520 RepID=A0ABP8GDK7_9BACT
MSRILLTYLFLLATLCGAAQTLTVTADRQRILIGEPIELVLKATGPQVPPPFALDSIPHFEILERSKVDTLLNGSAYTLQQTLRITSWDSGRWIIPPLRYGAGASAPLPVQVSFSSPFDPKQPYHEEKDILGLAPPERSTWMWYLVIALIVLLLVLLLFPARKKGPAPPPRVDPNYYRTVLQQLQQLERDEARRRDPKQFYTELVGLFRQYLYQRKRYQSDAETTGDLVARMGSWRLSGGMQGALRQTLEESDLVKFARHRPASGDLDRSVQTIKEAVIAIEENS